MTTIMPELELLLNNVNYTEKELKILNKWSKEESITPFDVKVIKQCIIDKAIYLRLAAFIQMHNRIPEMNGPNKEESVIAKWLYHQHQKNCAIKQKVK